MTKVVFEEDAYLKCIPVILDPDTPDEHCRAVADWMSPDVPDFFDWVRRVRGQWPGLFPAQVVEAMDQDDLRDKLADADAVMVERFNVGARELDAAKCLKVVQKFGGITSNIDSVACAERGVAVCLQRRRVNISVAEQAFAMIIALGRRFPELNGLIDRDNLQKAGFDTKPFDRRYTGNSNFARIPGLRTLYGSVLGALGLGEIGREVASRAAAFGMRVLYYQRTRLSPSEELALNATYASFEEVLANSDYISVHLPLTDATRNLIDRDALARVKKGTVLVNIARAEIVDRQALYEALDSGHLGGFGLDAGYEEPGSANDPLLAHKNVIWMPHTAPGSRLGGLRDVEEMCTKMWQALVMRHEEAT
jgi:phosphoglycerate dehydrogenase-like enzyme